MKQRPEYAEDYEKNYHTYVNMYVTLQRKSQTRQTNLLSLLQFLMHY